MEKLRLAIMLAPILVLGVVMNIDACTLQPSSHEVMVEMAPGGYLSGQILETVLQDGKYYSFKGVPFAKPPLGKLRFKAPEPLEPWTGVRPAKKDGPWCPQVNPFFGPDVLGEEDCLYLNVFSPNLNPDTLLPVMFFIHGGVWKFGSGTSEFYGPDFLVTKNIILVTINYRLDSLGFIDMGTKEVPGNAGLKDQVMALRWVRENIAKFGGDPEQVTIVGQSAGSASVEFHVLSEMSKGLFNRAISMSGVPFNDWVIEYKPVPRSYILAEMLGFETTNSTELLDFLQGVDYKDLIHKMATVLSSEQENDVIFKYLPFQPVVEKDYHDGQNFITVDPFVALATDDIPNKVDIMFGYTDAEAIIMIPLYAGSYIKRYNRFREMFDPSKVLFKVNPDTDLAIAQKIIDHYFGNKSISVSNMKDMVTYGSFASVATDVQRYFRLMPEFQDRTRFMYKFSCVSGLNFFGRFGAKYNITGAAHMDDLLYLFYAPALHLDVAKGTLDYKLIQQETTIFTNFIKYGNPTPPGSDLGISWPMFNNITLDYVDITDNGLVLENDPDAAEMAFWKEILADAGIPGSYKCGTI